jgi:hypothetical protein
MKVTKISKFENFGKLDKYEEYQKFENHLKFQLRMIYEGTNLKIFVYANISNVFEISKMLNTKDSLKNKQQIQKIYIIPKMKIHEISRIKG